MVLLEIFGWVSSGLVVLSLMQARVLRFRVMNLVGAAMATLYNSALGIWPFAAMNAAITVIDIYWLIRLLRERHDEAAYQVVEVGIDDAYLAHLLRVNAADVRTVYPDFEVPVAGSAGGPMGGPEAGGTEQDRSAFLVLRGDETVGMVVVRDAGSGVGQVELDYVTHRFRDFTPGEFVYRSSGIFADKGFDRLRLRDVPGERGYYERVGFHQVDGYWERPVERAAA